MGDCGGKLIKGDGWGKHIKDVHGGIAKDQ
jgi:hypothetical protein